MSAAAVIPGSPDLRIERVFPIRVRALSRETSSSGNTHSAPLSSPQPLDVEQDLAKENRYTSPVDVEIKSQPAPHVASNAPFVSTNFGQASHAKPTSRVVTERFNYLPEGDTKLPENPSGSQRIYSCEDEPIHIPGAIQQFGALVALREDDSGVFVIRIVSENSESVTGLKPDDLFDLRCFTDVFSKDDRTEFLIRVRALYADKSRTNPDVFTLSLTSNLDTPIPLFCAVHLNEGSDLIICEFELEKDVFNPIHQVTSEGLPKYPIKPVGHEVAAKELLLSTTSRSKPLHAVNVARQSSRQLGSMELFHVICEIQEQLVAAKTLPDLLDIIVGLVSELTGFHRVMVYQFDESASGKSISRRLAALPRQNYLTLATGFYYLILTYFKALGSVVSELMNSRATSDVYRGLRFPASDIPKQARELYLLNTIRILYDREQETARLICRTLEDSSPPLDLKHSYLRAMSPIHLKYLGNMGVRASMSISLITDGHLWGLISCHGYGAGMRVSLPVRELCRGLGNIASSNIQKLLYASRIEARRPLSNAPPKVSPTKYISASSSDLLNMFGADLGFIVIRGEARTVGKLFAYGECIALLQYIRQRAFTSVFASHAVQKDCLDLTYAPGLATISGLLFIPLAFSGADFLVFFRKGQRKEVNWAGNPHEKTQSRSATYLEPRSSFKRWSENVFGTSREWTEDQIENAVVLSTLYGRFVEVWRQKEAIVQKNRMTRLLIRNAGHEVRTPLNSIINYLEVALEETLDENARDHLQKSLQASKSLVFVVNDLLNLTGAEDSQIDIHEDNTDLELVITEVIHAFKNESSRPNLEIMINISEGVPSIIRCDPGGLRQVVSNLLANSIQNSTNGLIEIELQHLNTSEEISYIEMSFQDRGTGLSEQELDSIFQDFEQVLDDDEIEATALNVENASDTHKRQLQIGLGLAIAARFVRHNNGQISVSSEGKGKGTRVSVKIPFRKAVESGLRIPKASLDIFLPTPPHDLHNLQISETQASPSSDSTRNQEPPGNPMSPTVMSPDINEVISPVTGAGLSSPESVNASSATGQYPFPISSSGQLAIKLNVLIAEDNPLNSRLLETRLSKRGHSLVTAVDGQACADVFQQSEKPFDIILMDIQMPILDGREATRLIRTLERNTSKTSTTSNPTESCKRIPIIAVSASLSEQSRDEYVDIGFDGWVLKPINFKRLEAILSAVRELTIRKTLLYGNDSWEKGGWFNMKGEELSTDAG